ncbi:hypothetical protein PIB30_102112 [Stylosanthes scabra]|uniref:Putative plant transposon protein domain-containing protein n=1 Tax=Stylosanthes scabra TaxID=79078 RepID=A0ABU6QYI9_9FABA|nr:hypothetical protein [Stylosanthes scabra]
MASSSHSRKRKGKGAPNYDIAKFKSLFHEDHYMKYTKFREVLLKAQIEVDAQEFAAMRTQINLRKLQRLTKPIQVVGYFQVREFYANAWVREDKTHQPLSYSTFVRSQDTSFSPKAIHKVLNLRSKPIPNAISYHDRKAQNDVKPDDVLRELCVEGAQWVLHDDGRHHLLRRTDLKPMARGWYEFVIRSIMPTGNRSKVNVERAVLIHSIITGEDIQVDEIIAEQIYKFINKIGIRTKLPFSGIIQRLCNEAKVSIPEDTMILVEPHINSKWMVRVRGEKTGRRDPPPEPQNEEAAEAPQAPQFQEVFPPNFMDHFHNAMAAMQLQNNQRWDVFEQRLGVVPEEN